MMKETDTRGLLWLAAMFAGLMLMIPLVWLYNEILVRFARRGLEPAGWIRDLLGLAAAMAGPALTVVWTRHHLDRRYPDSRGTAHLIPDPARPYKPAPPEK
jgi:hypothetical protein